MQRNSKYRNPDEKMIFGYSRNRKRIFVLQVAKIREGKLIDEVGEIKRS